jgi:hypothetical protein
VRCSLARLIASRCSVLIRSPGCEGSTTKRSPHIRPDRAQMALDAITARFGLGAKPRRAVPTRQLARSLMGWDRFALVNRGGRLRRDSVSVPLNGSSADSFCAVAGASRRRASPLRARPHALRTDLNYAGLELFPLLSYLAGTGSQNASVHRTFRGHLK